MKKILLSLAFIAGCASTDYGGIKTPSPLYSAKLASEHGLTQAQTDKCVAVGLAAWGKAYEDFRNVAAGKAYEACVAR